MEIRRLGLDVVSQSVPSDSAEKSTQPPHQEAGATVANTFDTAESSQSTPNIFSEAANQAATPQMIPSEMVTQSVANTVPDSWHDWPVNLLDVDFVSLLKSDPDWANRGNWTFQDIVNKTIDAVLKNPSGPPSAAEMLQKLQGIVNALDQAYPSDPNAQPGDPDPIRDMQLQISNGLQASGDPSTALQNLKQELQPWLSLLGGDLPSFGFNFGDLDLPTNDPKAQVSLAAEPKSQVPQNPSDTARGSVEKRSTAASLSAYSGPVVDPKTTLTEPVPSWWSGLSDAFGGLDFQSILSKDPDWANRANWTTDDVLRKTVDAALKNPDGPPSAKEITQGLQQGFQLILNLSNLNPLGGLSGAFGNPDELQPIRAAVDLLNGAVNGTFDPKQALQWVQQVMSQDNWPAMNGPWDLSG